MKKILAGLVILGLVSLVSGTALADVIPSEELPTNEIPEISLPIKIEPVDVVIIPEVSLERVIVEMKTAIESQPVNLVAYIGIGFDYLMAIVTRLLETGKPSVLFYEEVKGGIEITLLENLLIRNLDLVGGLILNGNEEGISEDWKDKTYLGLEYQIFIPGIWDIFSEFSIGIYSSREGICLGLAFKI